MINDPLLLVPDSRHGSSVESGMAEVGRRLQRSVQVASPSGHQPRPIGLRSHAVPVVVAHGDGARSAIDAIRRKELPAAALILVNPVLVPARSFRLRRSGGPVFPELPLGIPGAIIWGTDDPSVAPADIAQAARALPDGPRRRVREWSHLPMVDDPNRFAEVLDDVLQRIETSEANSTGLFAA